MKTRVYCHNGKLDNEKDYVEFDLGNYTTSDIERVKEDHFTAMGKNCYLKVFHMPDTDKEDRMVSYFSWQKKDYKCYDYNVQARYAVINGEIQAHISDETFKELDAYLNKDREEYERWMSAN